MELNNPDFIPYDCLGSFSGTRALMGDMKVWGLLGKSRLLTPKGEPDITSTSAGDFLAFGFLLP